MGKVQGEGDYESAKRFDDDEAKFVKSGRVDQAARDAEPKSQAEADEMKKAEERGRSRSKGEDPSARKPSPNKGNRPRNTGKKLTKEELGTQDSKNSSAGAGEKRRVLAFLDPQPSALLR